MVENVVVFRNTHSSGYKDEGDCRPKCELREHPVKLDKYLHKMTTQNKQTQEGHSSDKIIE
jgi:hypothetical protein